MLLQIEREFSDVIILISYEIADKQTAFLQSTYIMNH